MTMGDYALAANRQLAPGSDILGSVRITGIADRTDFWCNSGDGQVTIASRSCNYSTSASCRPKNRSANLIASRI